MTMKSLPLRSSTAKSERQFQAKLNLPRGAGAEDLAKVWREGEAVGYVEIWGVEEIENLRAKLNTLRLAKLKKLHRG